MKRRIVQHGPCTLTVSLPADWIKGYALKKGDEINVEQIHEGLLITTGKERSYNKKHIDIRGMSHIAPRVITALYKAGYDEITVEFDGPQELEEIHNSINASQIGFEIIDEGKEAAVIKKVSEPSQEEFKTLFRRVFYFLLSTSEEGLSAIRQRDKNAYKKLVMRHAHIIKLANFCRRVVNKRGQDTYQQDTAIYHLLEQLEKIGTDYKEIFEVLLEQDKVSTETAELYAQVNDLLKEYENVFFLFSLKAMDEFLVKYKEVSQHHFIAKTIAEERVQQRLHSIAQELCYLSEVTMILRL